MRQKGPDQELFRNILDNISTGKFSVNDWRVLQKQSLKGGDHSLEHIENVERNSIKICARNVDSIDFNTKRIKALNNPYGIIISENNNSVASKANALKAQGLPSRIMICNESEVMLKSNLWKEAGLTNGCKGTVKFILYERNKKPPSLPSAVLIQFHDYIGPSFNDQLMPRLVPIVPIKRTWYEGSTLCYRIMLPITLAYATSIHSSQGMTAPGNVIVNLSSKEFANGLTYTALSRCKKLENLYFDPFPNYIRFYNIFGTKMFRERLENDKKEIEEDSKFQSEFQT
jgi:hypothetical protein